MSDQLIELSRSRHQTGAGLYVEDYTKHPALCRSGIWVGWRTTFQETVTLAYEHSEDPFYVGWMLNGVTVVDPGYSTGTPPWGSPVPGFPSLTYVCPFGGLFHEISITSTAGDPHECLPVQVLFRGSEDAGVPAKHGPTTTVCMSGAEIDWPAGDLAAERACLERLFEKMRRYVEIAIVHPGDPVEWLAQFRGEIAVRVKAEIAAIDSLDIKSQGKLASAIKADLAGILRARMPGAKIIHKLNEKPE